MGDATKQVTTETFDAEVLRSIKPVLVDFWATWCTPCLLVAPVLDEIAVEHAADLDIVKVNIDENPQIAQQYGIMSIPTMSLFRNGELAAQIVGAKPKSVILRELAPYL